MTTIFLVECYDAERDEWYREKWGAFKQFLIFLNFLYNRLTAADMNVYRSAVSTCVLSGLDNVKRYLNRDQKI